MQALAKNGVLVLSSITGGGRSHHPIRRHQPVVRPGKQGDGRYGQRRPGGFREGVRDLAQAESAYPGWLEQLLTHPVRGFENWPMLFEALNGKKGVIKAFLEVRPS